MIAIMIQKSAIVKRFNEKLCSKQTFYATSDQYPFIETDFKYLNNIYQKDTVFGTPNYKRKT